MALTYDGLQFGARIAEAFSSLYMDPEIIDSIGRLAAAYVSEVQSGIEKRPLPEELKPYTAVTEISQGNVPLSADSHHWLADHLAAARFHHQLGNTGEEAIRGPLVAYLFRNATVPFYLGTFAKAAEHMEPQERSKYTDPPILQDENLMRFCLKFYDDYADTEEDVDDSFLKDYFELIKDLAKLANEVRERFEGNYFSNTSTRAYETFGAAHLMPATIENRITATSPGVMIPTEADPLRYRNSIPNLEQNVVRPVYFKLMRLGAELIGNRRYLASLEGTRKALQTHPQLAKDSKKLLDDWLGIGESKFDLRLGTLDPALKNVTFVTPWGLVLSVRGPDKKIAHNVTVTDSQAAARYGSLFDESFAKARPVRGTSIIDELVSSGPAAPPS